LSLKVFFSWQNDIPGNVGRYLIEEALKDALVSLIADAEIEGAIREGLEFDKDTLGVAGTPPIFDTILNKINRAAIFLADVTFVGTRLKGDPTPNPNVLLEYGWALRSIGYGRILTVMNEAFGIASRETMPFDMAHLRFPIRYALAVGATAEQRKKAKEELSRELKNALKILFASEEFNAYLLTSAPKIREFQPIEPQDGRARFRTAGAPVGLYRHPLEQILQSDQREIFLDNGAAIWLRVMPVREQGRSWLNSELESALPILATLPLSNVARSCGFLWDEDGCGYFLNTNGDHTYGLCFAFRSGELWAIDASPAHLEGILPFDEQRIAKSLEIGAAFLEKLGIEGPYRWIAGIDAVKGKRLTLPDRPDRTFGPFRSNVIESAGKYSIDEPPNDVLRKYFDLVFDQCGLSRSTSNGE
jgi:hypothetical protein